jgi:hypothetical protein
MVSQLPSEWRVTRAHVSSRVISGLLPWDSPHANTAGKLHPDAGENGLYRSEESGSNLEPPSCRSVEICGELPVLKRVSILAPVCLSGDKEGIVKCSACSVGVLLGLLWP